MNTAFRVSLVLAVSMVLVACALSQSSPSAKTNLPANDLTPYPTLRPTVPWNPSMHRSYPVIVPAVEYTNEELPRYMLPLPDNSGYRLAEGQKLMFGTHTVTETVWAQNEELVWDMTTYQAPDATERVKRERLLAICDYYSRFGAQGVYLTVTQFVNSVGGCPDNSLYFEAPVSKVGAANEELHWLVTWYGYFTENDSRRQDYQAEICNRVSQMRREEVDTYITQFISDHGGCQ